MPGFWPPGARPFLLPSQPQQELGHHEAATHRLAMETRTYLELGNTTNTSNMERGEKIRKRGNERLATLRTFKHIRKMYTELLLTV